MSDTWSSTRRTSSRTSPRSTSARPSATTVSTTWRATPTRRWRRSRPGDRLAHDVRRAVMRAVDHARAFFSALALARMGRGDDRLRVAPEWFARPSAHRASTSCGALDGLRGRAGARGRDCRREPGAQPTASTISPRWRAAPATSRPSSGSCSPRPIPATSISSRCGAAACSCAPRPSMCRASCGISSPASGGRHCITSATLSVDGGFAYIKQRLGLEDADELSVPSEFDYRTQTLLYLPRRMPLPRDERYAEAVAWETRAAAAMLARPRLRALHELRHDACGRAAAGARARVPGAGAGHRAAIGAARRVPAHAPCRALRHVVVLAGRRRARRGR